MKKLLVLAAMLAMAATMSAQDVTFTYKSGNGNNNNSNELMDKLFDRDSNGNPILQGSKYCGYTGDNIYAIVEASEPVYVWGYDFTTANDNDGGRRVTRWTLSGTNDAGVAADPNAAGWVTLSAPSKNDWVQGENFYKQRFFCDKNSIGKYKYYKLVLNEGGFVQLSDVTFLYEKKRVASYNWKEASNNGSKNAVDGWPDPKWGQTNLAGNWMTIETADGNPHSVKSYSFTTHDDGSCTDRAPKEWRLEGSNDNSNWVTIHEVTGTDPIENKTCKTYEFTPTNTTDAFRYLKLTLIKMKGSNQGDYKQIGEFHVLSTSDVSNEDYYTAKVAEAKANAFDRGSLSETDPWYVEYKTLYDGLDALLTSCKTSGLFDPIDVTLEKMTRLMSLMDQLKATTTDYVAFDGSSCWGDGHWSQLVDGKDGIDGRESTKWGAFFGGDDAVQYVIFRRKEALQPYFYRLVTGGDTYTQNGRNWKSWKVFGANFETLSNAVADSTKWVKLDERLDIDTEYLPLKNCYPAAFNFNVEGEPSEPYYYYMVMILDSRSRNNGAQMNEMYLCTQAEFESARAPLVAYFNDFDTTRPVETEYEDELAEFNTKYAELQTTDDAVKMTKLYNECVALRTLLECSMNFVELNDAVTVENGVYQLASAANLILFSKTVNGGKNELNAELTNNIDMASVTMAPIGTQDIPYKGTFNGRGKTIENYTYNHSDKNNVGLFGYINGATIQNVILKGATINGNANAGGLVGNAQNASTIKNNAVVSSSVEGRDHVAAIAANAVGETVISNNYSNATIKSRNYQAGGMVGTIMSATIEKNLFTGTVTCENGGDASGLVSRIDGVANPVPIVRNNMVAASTITGGNTYAIIRADWTDRTVSFADNYVLKSTIYSTGGKTLTNKDDRNGLQIDWIQATTKDFYETTLGWNFTDDWKFTCGGKYPILKIMADEALPTQDLAITAEAGYATMVAKYDYDFTGASFEAFAVTESEKENVVHLEPVTSAKHGEALLLKNENGVNFTQTATTTAKAATTGNLLKASDGSVKGDGSTIYALAKKANGVGFYPVGNDVTIPEGKAYLEVATNTGGGGVKAFYGFEEDDATGISLMEDGRSKMEDGAIYNLAGQRLNKMQKGINIVNGKKVLK